MHFRARAATIAAVYLLIVGSARAEAPDGAQCQGASAPSDGSCGQTATGSAEYRRMPRPPPKTDSLFLPRFILIEADYPQIVAASVGAWMLILRVKEFQVGPVADVQVGFGGPAIAFGVGASSAQSRSVEHVSSFGVQGAILRSWPGWDPLLPTSVTFAGAEVFGHFFVFRCAVGVMWNVSDRQTSPSPFPIGGCGLGLP